MTVTDPIELIRATLANEGKVLMLSDGRVRTYNRHHVTVATIDLDTLPDNVQETIIDLIMPYID